MIQARRFHVDATKRILLIEDNADLAFGLRNNLELEGYEVGVAADGKAGLDMLRASGTDLVILDLMLPEMDGFNVLKEIRKGGSTVPILILTARGEEADKVTGLRLGADDYVTKPFGLMELLARVEALLRRAETSRDEGGAASGPGEGRRGGGTVGEGSRGGAGGHVEGRWSGVGERVEREGRRGGAGEHVEQQRSGAGERSADEGRRGGAGGRPSDWRVGGRRLYGVMAVARFGSIEVDPARRTVTRAGAPVDLSPKEFDLLVALIRHDGAVVSRQDLLDEVWGYADDVLSRTVDTHVAELRRKLEDDPANPRYILTARKAGYRLAR